jgi:AbiV family abortive infection protein
LEARLDNGMTHIQQVCLNHAAELIVAAAKLLEEDAHPHLAYHLSLLALEEIGKGAMIAAKAAVGNERDSGWLDKWLASHKRKIQWAVWSPMQKIDPSDFEEARKFAENVHARRLASLYVDPNADISNIPPRENVTNADAMSVLRLARTRLELAQLAGNPSGETDELLEWFLETVDDPEKTKRLFSKSFLDKYAAFGGDTRAWTNWAKEECDRIALESSTFLAQKLSKGGGPVETDKPRWQAQSVIYTPSHSLRPKILNYWNDRIEIISLLWTGKKDQFLLEITLPGSIGIDDVHGKAVSLGKLALACLNIGSIGYFWFEPPGFEVKLFQQFKDLENPKSTLQFERTASFWGTGRAVALDSLNMQHAVNCMMAYAPLNEEEAEPIFRPYLDGLALIAKSDIFYSFDELARRAFVSALAGALHKFESWDGEIDTFETTLHAAFEPFMPDCEHRYIAFDSLKAKPTKENSQLKNLRTAKQLADLYLLHVANTH